MWTWGVRTGTGDYRSLCGRGGKRQWAGHLIGGPVSSGLYSVSPSTATARFDVSTTAYEAGVRKRLAPLPAGVALCRGSVSACCPCEWLDASAVFGVR